MVIESLCFSLTCNLSLQYPEVQQVIHIKRCISFPNTGIGISHIRTHPTALFILYPSQKEETYEKETSNQIKVKQ